MQTRDDDTLPPLIAGVRAIMTDVKRDWLYVATANYAKGHDPTEDEVLVNELFYGRAVPTKTGRKRWGYPVRDSRREHEAFAALIRLISFTRGTSAPRVKAQACQRVHYRPACRLAAARPERVNDFETPGVIRLASKRV